MLLVSTSSFHLVSSFCRPTGGRAFHLQYFFRFLFPSVSLLFFLSSGLMQDDGSLGGTNVSFFPARAFFVLVICNFIFVLEKANARLGVIGIVVSFKTSTGQRHGGDRDRHRHSHSHTKKQECLLAQGALHQIACLSALLCYCVHIR